MTEKKKNHLIRYIAAAALIFSVICNVVCLALLLKPESSGGENSVSGEESRFINIQAVEGEVSKLSWAGKTWCSYGDSITQEEKWQSYVTEYFGFEKHYNRGIGSSTFAQSDQVWYANEDGSYNSRPGFDGVTEAPEGTTEHEGYLCSSDRIDVSIPEDADLVVVMGGTNDMGSNVPIGDLSYPFDETTFMGAVASTIVKLQEKVPDAVIVLVSPLSGRGPETEDDSVPANSDTDQFAVNDLGLTTKDYRDAMEEVAEAMSIPFIDVYGTTGINQWNRSEYIRDIVHPSDLGGMAIARSVIAGLEDIKPNLISEYTAADGQLLADTAAVKENADGSLSAELNQIQWTRSETDSQTLLTAVLPETLNSGVLSLTLSDASYYEGFTLEISEDGENWQMLYAGLDYEIWGDTLWASFPETAIRQIRIGHWNQCQGGCTFQLGFYQDENSSEWFSSGSRIDSVTASVNSDQTGNMTDHDLTTRWSSGSAQTEGTWVTVQLSESCVLNGARLELGDSIGDYPASLQIQVSEDGYNWISVEAESQDQIDFRFDPVECRYLRLELGQIPEGTTANWSIHELTLYTEVGGS